MKESDETDQAIDDLKKALDNWKPKPPLDPATNDNKQYEN
jgi:hypothetical protein